MNNFNKLIFLVGARASGKSTVGQLLAERCGLNFVDMDDCLARAQGLNIAEIVARDGWDIFRQKESEMLSQIIENQAGAVVATGGGVVMAERNRALMWKNGLIFYLSASPEILADRMANDPRGDMRPSLTGKPVLEEMGEILVEREGRYRATAHQTIDAAVEPDAVAATILGHLKVMTG